MNKITFLLIIMILVWTGCSRSADSGQSSGQSAEPKHTGAMRIISAAPSNTEIVAGLSLGDRLIAIDKYSHNVQGVPAGLPLIDFFYPDAEAIIGLDPDLLLVNEINTFGIADDPFTLLGDLGINVVYIPTSTSIEGIYRDIRLIADTLDVKERGEALVNSMKLEIEKIGAPGRLADSQGLNRKKVYFEISAMPSLVSFGRETYLNEMIEIAGGKNIFTDQTGWFSPSDEEVINRNPDIIFALAHSSEDPLPDIMGRKTFEGLTAIKLNQVYVIDGESASRPSQYIMQSLHRMARAINPEYDETAR